MFVKEVTVENQVGLHARPATFFIQKANEFKSSIWVEKEERRVNAKSLLGVLSLGIVGGTTIRIIADGADEQAAVEGSLHILRAVGVFNHLCLGVGSLGGFLGLVHLVADKHACAGTYGCAHGGADSRALALADKLAHERAQGAGCRAADKSALGGVRHAAAAAEQHHCAHGANG